MAIKVTISAVLPDWWGADEAWENNGAERVYELIKECPIAFLTGKTTVWTIEKMIDPEGDQNAH
jgi:hypothetical protein